MIAKSDGLIPQRKQSSLDVNSIMGIFSSLFGGGIKKLQETFVISDKELLVRGWSEAELKQIIGDFIKPYAKRLPSNFSMEIHARERAVLAVTFPVDIEPLIFCFLVNYVQYPKGFDLKSRTALVAGKAIIRSDFLPSEQSLIGKRLLIYIPANDQQYDIVYGQVDNQSYEFPFSATEWRRAPEPRLPAGIDELK